MARERNETEAAGQQISFVASDVSADGLQDRNSMATVIDEREQAEAQYLSPSDSTGAMSNDDNEANFIKYDTISPKSLDTSLGNGSTLVVKEKHPVALVEEPLKVVQPAGNHTVRTPTHLDGTLISSQRQIQIGLSVIAPDLNTVQSPNCILFPNFKKLAVEIRLMIWRTALFKPTVINLQLQKRHIYLYGEINIWRPKSWCRIRHVCKEARGEAQQFQTSFLPETIQRPLFYMNRDVDTIFLADDAYYES
ncbi:hypothetical protein ONS95_001304 [Cadophora gregata]|uniref:uncharacterized protein n=1 Tax=Cadophora gregata TaxID=51156 RepID=UPI0026DBA89E|nr:uncharacterized protein ONS95_001304 [Cadophora gregata]KAK0101884.1 hypothetical protein ONS96_005859 [Cadophora gregata f. sp. sojae]KAK0129378.1 hypothetical protein ONS95_001304 [Cadophora gregata]